MKTLSDLDIQAVAGGQSPLQCIASALLRAAAQAICDAISAIGQGSPP
jgi:hypothetical protein